MNQMLPEYGMQAGLRSFGHHPQISTKDTVVFYGIEPYDKSEFGRILYEIAPARFRMRSKRRKKIWRVFQAEPL